jgi:hypothetical protein
MEGKNIGARKLQSLTGDSGALTDGSAKEAIGASMNSEKGIKG